MSEITYSTRNGIAHIELHHHPHNILSRCLIVELNRALEHFFDDVESKVLILSAKGPSFSAGADIHELKTVTPGEHRDVWDWQMLAASQKPTIACVHGMCLGGGLEIALMCDLMFASEDAVFALPEATLGVIPGGGGISRLMHHIGYTRALHMALTGLRIDAKTALSYGLLCDVLPTPEDCLQKGMDTAFDLCQLQAEVLYRIKVLMKQAKNTPVHESVRRECSAFYDQLFSKDGKTGITEFLSKKSQK